MFTNGITEMTNGHSPIVAHEPLDLRWAYEFCKGKLVWLGEGFHNVRAHIVHRALSDETFEIPQAQKLDMVRQSVRGGVRFYEKVQVEVSALNFAPRHCNMRMGVYSSQLKPNQDIFMQFIRDF